VKGVGLGQRFMLRMNIIMLRKNIIVSAPKSAHQGL
jgi:hypothetical protein